MPAPSTLARNVFEYEHPEELIWPNEFYGPHYDQRFDLYRNATEVTGGNPCLIIVHGGSYNANDKSGFTRGTQEGRFYHSFFLDGATYGHPRKWTVIGAEYSCHSHEGLTTHASSIKYEPVLSHPLGIRCGRVSRPTYYGRAKDDIQRLVQYVRDNASRLKINPDQIVLFGHSMGGYTSLSAAFTRSRRFNPNAKHPYEARSAVKVRGVCVWAAEVDLSPNFLYHRVSKYVLNMGEPDDARVRARMERALLLPDSSGAYSTDSPKSKLCEDLSPVDLISRALPEHRSVRVHAYYRKNFEDGAGDPTIEETIGVPPGYVNSGGPPYWASGHDWREFAPLQAACEGAGVQFSGEVLDGEDGAAYTAIGNPQMEAYESTCAPTELWAAKACGLVPD